MTRQVLPAGQDDNNFATFRYSSKLLDERNRYLLPLRIILA